MLHILLHYRSFEHRSANIRRALGRFERDGISDETAKSASRRPTSYVEEFRVTRPILRVTRRLRDTECG